MHWRGLICQLLIRFVTIPTTGSIDPRVLAYPLPEGHPGDSLLPALALVSVFHGADRSHRRLLSRRHFL